MTVTIPEKLGEYVLDASDKAMIEEYQFVVTTSNSHFVVRDPTMPKRRQKYEGGNLYDLLMQATKTREEYEIAKTVAWAASGKKASTKMDVIVKDNNENNETQTIQQPNQNKPKARKEIEQTKLFKIKKLFWSCPTTTPANILKQLQNEGVTTSLGTVQMTISDFIHSVRTLHLLGVVTTENRNWAMCIGADVRHNVNIAGLDATNAHTQA